MAVPTISDTPPGEGDHAGHERRRFRVLLLVGAIALVLLIVAGWFVLGGEKAEQTSETEARQRLGAGSSVPSTGSDSSGAPLASPPAVGLYRYEGSGREKTSFPPLTEDQGPQMPATVTQQANGCWVLRIDYNTHHWQDWTYCTAGGQLTELRGSTYSKRNFGGLDVENTSTFSCDPPAVLFSATDVPGTSHPRSCVGSGSLVPAETLVAGPMTVVGQEVVQVGNRSVPATHIRYELAYSGGQLGTEKTDQWLATSTGLVLRNEHQIRVDTDTPFGTVTYTEDAQFSLQTPDPV